jgi:hypothetical protein
MANRKQQQLFAEMLTKDLIDKGLLIEAGWVGLRMAAIPDGAPPAQVDAMREVFYAGAQHLYGSLMSCLDPGKEPTDDDLRRMAMIHSELEEFVRQYKIKYGMA